MSTFCFTAPQFSEEDALRERSTFTAEELARIENRCLRNDGRDFIEETPALIEAGLRDMASFLADIPDKAAYEEALLEAPHLVKHESAPIRFLRAEIFDAEAAAKRLVKYWEMRKTIFESRAFQPMHLDGAIQDEVETMRLMPELYFVTGKDDHGRLILISNKAHFDFTRYSRRSLTRLIWYHIHCHLDDIEVQKKGMIAIGIFKINSAKQYDRGQSKLSILSLSDTLPIRYLCGHICHPPGFFNIIYPAINFMLGKILRVNTIIHKGSDEHVLNELEQYGIRRHIILKCMGGTFDMNIDEWLIKRQQIEASLMEQYTKRDSEHDDAFESN